VVRVASRERLAAERQRLAATQQRLAAKRGELAEAQHEQRECEDAALRQLVLAPLPTALVRLIFLLVPVNARLTCREVCAAAGAPSWLTSLSGAYRPSAWSGALRERSKELLYAATERAQGTLEVLDVTGWRIRKSGLLADSTSCVLRLCTSVRTLASSPLAS